MPPPTACGGVQIDRVLDRDSMRHAAAEVVATLHLDATARVVRAVAVRGTLAAADKVHLPPGPRQLWLIYTVEPNATTTGAANLFTTASASLLHVVDDATLRSVGTTTCPR